MTCKTWQTKQTKPPKNIKRVLLTFIDVLQYAEEKTPRGVHENKNPFLSIWLRFPLRCTGLSGQVARLWDAQQNTPLTDTFVRAGQQTSENKRRAAL